MGDILALAGNIWQLHDKAGCWHHMKNGSSRACVLGVGRSMGSQEKNTDIADTMLEAVIVRLQFLKSQGVIMHEVVTEDRRDSRTNYIGYQPKNTVVSHDHCRAINFHELIMVIWMLWSCIYKSIFFSFSRN